MAFFNRRFFLAGFEVLPHHDGGIDVRSSSSSSDSRSSNPECGIRVEFVRRTVHSYFRQPYGGGAPSRLLLDKRVSVRTSSGCIDPRTFLSSYDDSYATIVRNLSKLRINSLYHKQIADEVIDWGQRVSESENCLRVKIWFVHEHTHEETRSETEFIDPYEDDGNGIVATSESPKRGLKRKRIDEADGETTKPCLKCLPHQSSSSSCSDSHSSNQKLSSRGNMVGSRTYTRGHGIHRALRGMGMEATSMDWWLRAIRR